MKINKDEIFSNVNVKNSLQVPIFRTFPEPSKGSIIFSESTQMLYGSNGETWTPLDFIVQDLSTILENGDSTGFGSIKFLQEQDPYDTELSLLQLPSFSSLPNTLSQTDTGSIAYNQQDDSLYYYNGTTWLPVSSGSSGTTFLSSSGGDVSLVDQGTGPNLAVKGLTAGPNISLADNGTYIEISSSGGGSQTLGQTLALGNTTGGLDIVMETGGYLVLTNVDGNQSGSTTGALAYDTNASNLVVYDGGAWVPITGGGGGSQTLEQTLALGDATGNNNIVFPDSSSTNDQGFLQLRGVNILAGQVASTLQGTLAYDSNVERLVFKDNSQVWNAVKTVENAFGSGAQLVDTADFSANRIKTLATDNVNLFLTDTGDTITISYQGGGSQTPDLATVLDTGNDTNGRSILMTNGGGMLVSGGTVITVSNTSEISLINSSRMNINSNSYIDITSAGKTLINGDSAVFDFNSQSEQRIIKNAGGNLLIEGGYQDDGFGTRSYNGIKIGYTTYNPTLSSFISNSEIEVKYEEPPDYSVISPPPVLNPTLNANFEYGYVQSRNYHIFGFNDGQTAPPCPVVYQRKIAQFIGLPATPTGKDLLGGFIQVNGNVTLPNAFDIGQWMKNGSVYQMFFVYIFNNSASNYSFEPPTAESRVSLSGLAAQSGCIEGRKLNIFSFVLVNSLNNPTFNVYKC